MSDQQPLVSIITPFFNEEKFIEEMIQSVLGQTWENWELILADDGSADKSTDIARKYASLYPDRIQYFDHPGHGNLGSSASRSRAIQQAGGDLVAFLDADDIFLPKYLENQVKVFQGTAATMVCEATLYWYSWDSGNDMDDGDGKDGGRKKDTVIPVGVPLDRLYRPQELNLLVYPLKKNAAAPCMCSIIVSREALLKHGEFEESFRRNYTDQVFLSKMYYNEPVYISSSCNNYYRQRSDSMMAVIKDVKEYNKIRLQFLEWFKSYVEKSGNSNRKICKLINRNLLPYKHPVYYAVFHVYPRRILKKMRRIAGKGR